MQVYIYKNINNNPVYANVFANKVSLNEIYGKKALNMTIFHPPNNTITIRYTDDNQGFLDHKHKFELALDALPDCCKVLREGGYISSGFISTGFITDTPADFEARMSVFYADFDKQDNYNSILKPLEVNRDLLVKAVDDFLVFIRGQNYP
jgi:hypothetical protein